MKSPQKLYAEGSEALARDEYATAASLLEQACMAVLRSSFTVATMRQEVTAVEKAAVGDSNDEEIRALQEALEVALTRWPEVKYGR